MKRSLEQTREARKLKTQAVRIWRKEDPGQDPLMIELFQKSMDLGNAESAFILGSYYQHHRIDDGPGGKMQQAYQRAAELGCHKSMFNLGYQYLESTSAEMKEKAFSLFQQAADLGNDRAMVALGVHYEKTRDYLQMVKYYRMADLHGNSEGIRRLFEHYQRTGQRKLASKYLEYGVSQNLGWAYYEYAIDLDRDDTRIQFKTHIKKALSLGHLAAALPLMDYYSWVKENDDKMIQLVESLNYAPAYAHLIENFDWSKNQKKEFAELCLVTPDPEDDVFRDWVETKQDIVNCLGELYQKERRLTIKHLFFSIEYEYLPLQSDCLNPKRAICKFPYVCLFHLSKLPVAKQQIAIQLTDSFFREMNQQPSYFSAYLVKDMQTILRHYLLSI